MKLIEYPDAELMMLHLAETLASELSDFLTKDGKATLAVPGGTTPGPIFDALCVADLDWDRVTITLTDERWVPETHDRSNTALLRKRLLTGRAAAATLLPLYADGQTADAALPDLIQTLDPHLPLSVCLLGMGADMHTASLFPGADNLTKALTTRAPLVPITAPGAPEPRLTLTAHALNQAYNRHIVITGAEKREALEQAQSLPPEQAPVAAILAGTTVHWAPS